MDKTGKIREFYEVLYRRYGQQHWWPAETRFECIIGAILTQNTSWENASKAVSKLKSEIRLTPENLRDIPEHTLAGLIRTSGYYNQKAKKIRSFINFLFTNYSGNLDTMFSEDKQVLRNMLLGIKGIGPETADTILLYAGEKPVFVVDKYTYRILSRHMIIPESADYNEISELFTLSLAEDYRLYNEYHALIVRLGKEHCRANPLCNGCPLQYDLEERCITPDIR